MAQKMRIKLRAYDNVILDKSVQEIIMTAKKAGAIISGPVPLPTKKRVYTILRSPHVNKRSREQFEIRIHRRLIDIHEADSRIVDGMMKIDLPAGVDIELLL
ncbi:MAG: 30S ribosomal protein S10 [Candidatus Zixiibacteriota bacterium]